MTLIKEKTEDVQRAIEKMRSLRDGDLGVIDAVACGRRAVPALRNLLFEREPSGIYQPRCWAARALSILGAYDALFEFLDMAHEARDPVERAGDDAVINSAARHLSVLRDERVFRLLMRLANTRLRPGVIGALATFHREEAMPYFVAALGEDDCRLIAEPVLVAFGRIAQPLLLEAATTPSPSAESESETSIRKRRSALALLMEMGVPIELWPSLRGLVFDQDPRIAVLACDLCLSVGREEEWGGAAQRLAQLLENASWRRESDIEECLVRHYGRSAKTITAMLRHSAENSDTPPQSREILLRVRARGERRNLPWRQSHAKHA